MSSPAVITLNQEGYAVVGGIIDRAAVEQLREVCQRVLPTAGEMRPSRFLSEPDLVGVPFGEAALHSIQEIVGTGFQMFPNFTVRADVYASWHVDAGFERAPPGNGAGEFLQCAVYLQDNDEHEGGGLDVVPASHRLGMHTEPTFDDLVAVVRSRRTISARAGDLLVWDARVMHRGTVPRTPARRRKLGIHWTVARAGIEPGAFMAHLVRRGTVEVDGASSSALRYREIATMRFPWSYPESVVRTIARWKVKMVTPQAEGEE
jgi:hypothetical protein